MPSAEHLLGAGREVEPVLSPRVLVLLGADQQ